MRALLRHHYDEVMRLTGAKRPMKFVDVVREHLSDVMEVSEIAAHEGKQQSILMVRRAGPGGQRGGGGAAPSDIIRSRQQVGWTCKLDHPHPRGLESAPGCQKFTIRV